MSYSEHFRKKVLAKLEEGCSIRAITTQFKIGKSTSKLSEYDLINLLRLAIKYPDDFQYERATRFGCGNSSISDGLRYLGITIKKDAKSSKSSPLNLDRTFLNKLMY